MRDGQKERVYEAERRLRTMLDNAAASGNPVVELDGITLTLPPEARYGDLAGIQSYCDRACALVGARNVKVRERQTGHAAHYESGGVVAVNTSGTRWAMREVVILHELAHHLSPGDKHGPRFVSAFIDILSRVMGPEAGLAMRLLCSHAGVREGRTAVAS